VHAPEVTRLGNGKPETGWPSEKDEADAAAAAAAAAGDDDDKVGCVADSSADAAADADDEADDDDAGRIVTGEPGVSASGVENNASCIWRQQTGLVTNCETRNDSPISRIDCFLIDN